MDASFGPLRPSTPFKLREVGILASYYFRLLKSPAIKPRFTLMLSAKTNLSSESRVAFSVDQTVRG